MKSIRCLLGSHVNDGLSESRTVFRCGRCGKACLASLDDLYREVLHDLAMSAVRFPESDREG